MARGTALYTVTEDNRDKGKTFLITELSSARGESWAMRAILALMHNGVQLPDGFNPNMGMAAMAEIGIRALEKLKWSDAEPLLNEMFECVAFIPDVKKPQVVRSIYEEDIEEITTRVELRTEVWKLHVGFLKAAALSKFKEQKATAEQKVSPNI